MQIKALIGPGPSRWPGIPCLMDVHIKPCEIDLRSLIYWVNFGDWSQPIKVFSKLLKKKKFPEVIIGD